MGLLTIGAFGRACGLSQKALRLYDDLGLLAPARVDPVTGYRWYAPEQLERARLVAWLRGLGMPLARIREVCALEPTAAAGEVRAFWSRVEADTAARRELAAFLVDHLTGRDTHMTTMDKPLRIRYAALTDTGLVREGNQDTAYAGARLLAVADGFGEGGAPASAAAVDALKRLEDEAIPSGSLLGVLREAIDRAGRAVQGIAAGARSRKDPRARAGTGEEAGTGSAGEAGTTLTAMLWTGSQLGLVHIGDSRAYLLRDGEFLQITRDHTLVQSMVDDGRLTPEEAVSHPQRALLLRALADGVAATADVRLQDVRAGDRYLLCSDGLSAVVATDEVRRVVSLVAEPGQAVRELVATANLCGGPDNVSCVVADVVEPADAA